MKKNLSMLFVLILLLALTACSFGAAEPETAAPTEGISDEDVAALMDSTQIFTPEPGYYVVSSVGENGDITFFGDLNPANGYLKLEEDHTGMMLYNDTEQELTWDEDSIIWGGEDVPFLGTSYYSSELEQTETMVMVYFMDSATSVIFRPAEEPAD